MLPAPYKIGVETPTYKRLTEVIKTSYGVEKLAQADGWLRHICTYRKKVLSGHKLDRQTAASLLKQYYKDFEVLTKYFKFTEKEKKKSWLEFRFFSQPSCSVKFVWCDAYDSEQRASSYFPGLEKGAVLWNIGAFCSSVALKTEKSVEGYTEAVNLLRESAGTFRYLSQTTEIMDSEFTPDLSRESCEFMAMFMIAQAQAIFVQIAATKKMSAGLVAKLAQGGAFLFEKALKALKGSKRLVTWVQNSGGCRLIEHSKCQQSCLKARAQFWQAKLDAKEDEYGQEIGRLRLALQWVKEANKTSVFVDESRTELMQLVSERLNEAEKDNNEIYHYKVLSLDDLPVIGEKVVCKEKEFSLADIKPLESPIKDWVPVTVMKANNDIKEKLLKRKDEIEINVKEQNDIAAALMASLGLPAKLDSTESSTKKLPDIVWGRIHEFQNAGGMNRAGQMVQQLAQMAVKASAALKEILYRLDEEKKQDDQLRNKYGRDWGCVPSENITESYKIEATKISDFMAKADESNKALEAELQQNEMPFLGLCASRYDISGNIPVLTEPSDPKLATERNALAQALDELSKLLSDRQENVKKYSEEIVKTDMKGQMMSGLMSVEKATEMILSEFEKKEEVIQKNLKLQDDMIAAVETADKAYEELRNKSEVEKLREAKIHDLNETVTKYNKLCNNLEEGVKFYTALHNTHLKPLQDSVGDFLTARNTERQMLLEDLNVAASKMANLGQPRANVIPSQAPTPQQNMMPYAQPAYPMAQGQPAYAMTHGQSQYPMAHGQPSWPMTPSQGQYPMSQSQQPYINQRNQAPQTNWQLNQQQSFTSQPYGQPTYGQVQANSMYNLQHQDSSVVPPTAPTISYENVRKPDNK